MSETTILFEHRAPEHIKKLYAAILGLSKDTILKHSEKKITWVYVLGALVRKM